jgi:hypothetical protein
MCDFSNKLVIQPQNQLDINEGFCLGLGRNPMDKPNNGNMA